MSEATTAGGVGHSWFAVELTSAQVLINTVNFADRLYLGAREVSSVYVGDHLVWSRA
jgi:hypothetical protein